MSKRIPAYTLPVIAILVSPASLGVRGLGFGIDFTVGWDLILESGVASAAVAIGWPGYVDYGLAALGLHLPPSLLAGQTS